MSGAYHPNSYLAHDFKQGQPPTSQLGVQGGRFRGKQGEQFLLPRPQVRCPRFPELRQLIVTEPCFHSQRVS